MLIPAPTPSLKPQGTLFALAFVVMGTQSSSSQDARFNRCFAKGSILLAIGTCGAVRSPVKILQAL